VACPVRAYRYPGLPGSRVQFPSNDRLCDLGQSRLAVTLVGIPLVGRVYSPALPLKGRVLDPSDNYHQLYYSTRCN
jgi:hypothetical protein